MRQQKEFVADSDVQWQQVGAGVKRKIMAYDEKLMVVKVQFEKGSIGSIHSHYHSQVTHVERGTFEVNIDNEKKILKGGDAFYIPPHVLHGCVCFEEGVLIDVFSPMREDFVINRESQEFENRQEAIVEHA